MEKEFLVRGIRVYKVNGRLVVAEDVTEACEIFSSEYQTELIKEVVLLKGDSLSHNESDYVALRKEKLSENV